MAKDPFAIFEAQHEEGLKQLERLEGAVERLKASGASPELWEAIRGVPPSSTARSGFTTRRKKNSSFLP